MSRKRPASEVLQGDNSFESVFGGGPTENPEVTQPAEAVEGVAPPETPVAEPKPKKAAKVETPFQKVTRRLERAKRAYEKLPESDDLDSPEYKAKAKAKAHLDGCVTRYAAVAAPEPEAEVAEPV